MKRILYLNNYMSTSISGKRNADNIFSQPANNKVNGIYISLSEAGCNVQILSSGLVNSKSLKWFSVQEESFKGGKIRYCSIFDFPLINTFTSILSMYHQIRLENKKKMVDKIIFYNFKPEVAWAAWLAKKTLGIPIVVEFEDGYTSVEGLSIIKRWIFKQTEKIVSKSIDAAIVVNSKLADKFTVPTVIVRGVIDRSMLGKEQTKKKNILTTKLLYSGGLDIERGIKVAIESMKYLDKHFELYITGKGNLESEIKQIKDPRIHFKGFISYEEVQRMMYDVDILLQCQLENHAFGEMSFPSKVFEYMATGNRIVSSCVSDIEEFASGCFYFYQNDDPNQLAIAINSAYRDIQNSNTEVVENMKNKLSTLTPDVVGEQIISAIFYPPK